MSYRPLAKDAPDCCAFCHKPLTLENDLIQPWRSPAGLFFCNEFCADDAEEASFQSRRRADRDPHDDLGVRSGALAKV
jgi:hypothetical protein